MPESGRAAADSYVRCLGPVFACFAAALEQRVDALDASRLNFVGRDGWFLMQVAEAWFAGRDDKRLDYALLQRTRARLASLRHPADIAARCDDLRHTKTRDLSAASVVEYFALDATRFAFAADRGVDDAVRELRLRWDEVERHAEQARCELRRVVERCDVFVDIGWRGTLGTLLDLALPEHRRVKWLMLARWSDFGPATLRGGDEGLVVDMQVRASLKTKAAWDLFGLLEPLCKGEVSIDAAGRQSMRPVFPGLDPLRAAILDHVRAVRPTLRAADPAERPNRVAQLRREAHDALFALAYFPPAAVLELVDSASHEHGLDAWSEPIVSTGDGHPLRSPRRWLAKFACPWKGAWAYRSAGRAGALFWMLANLTLMTGGPRLIGVVQRIVLGLGRPRSSRAAGRPSGG